MHPLEQALQEYPEQQTQYTAIRRLLGARKERQTVQMWASLGYWLLRDESQFALVSNGEDANLIAPHDESVQGHIAGASVGNHELADIVLYAPAEQGMCGKRIDSGLYCRDCVQGGLWVVVAEELKGTFEVRQ